MSAATTASAASAQEEALHRQVEASFRKITAHQRRLRGRQRRYSVTQTALSGLTGLTAGVPAAAGSVPGGEWRTLCGLVAVAAFAATIIGVIQQGSHDSEELSQAAECLGKLRELRVELSAAPALPALQLRYRQILAAHAAIAE
jgi:hypothetical protein